MSDLMFVGVDLSNGPGWSAECDMERMADGRIKIHGIRRWRHELDLMPSSAASSSELPPSEREPDQPSTP